MCINQKQVRSLLFWILVIQLAGAPFAFAQQVELQYKPIVGQPHPDFVLPAIEDGKKIALSDLRGKKIVLIHFASW